MTSHMMDTRMGTTCGPTSLIAIAMGATACNEDGNSAVHTIFRSAFVNSLMTQEASSIRRRVCYGMHNAIRYKIHTISCTYIQSHAHTSRHCGAHSGLPQ